MRAEALLSLVTTARAQNLQPPPSESACRLAADSSLLCAGWVGGLPFNTTVSDFSIFRPGSLPPELPSGATPLESLALIGGGITRLAPYIFENVSVGELDLSWNMLTRIGIDDLAGLTADVFHLSHNALTWLEPGCFNGLTFRELNLAQNDLLLLPSLLFEGLSTAILNLASNRIFGVLPLAFNGSTIGMLEMDENPTTCILAPSPGNVLCHCGQPTILSINVTTNSSVSASPTTIPLVTATALPPVPECIYCAPTLRVQGLHLFNLMSQTSSTTTPPASTEARILSAPVEGLHLMTTNLTILGSLDFECPNGGVIGDECVVVCRDGFVGVPTTYTCSITGQWVRSANSTPLTCVFFPYANTSDIFDLNVSEIASTEADELPAFGVATQGEPYVVPPPRSYGQYLQFESFDLPAGLAMDANGQIIGIPEAPGNYTVTVQAIDISGDLLFTSAFTLSVAPALDITDERVIYVYKNAYFIYGEMMAVQGGRKPFRYFYEGTLPPGLRLDRVGDGPKISGHPRETGRWSGIIIEVVDAVGVRRVFPTITIVVQDPPSGISFRVQFFIALSVSVALIIASVALVGRHHYADKQDRIDTSAMAKHKEVSMILSTTDDTDCSSIQIDEPVCPRSKLDCNHNHQHRPASEFADKVTTGTRIFRKDCGSQLDPDFLVPLEVFVRKATVYSNRILIAAPLNDKYLCDEIEACLHSLADELQTDTLLELVRVPYWGKFTPPLNVLLRYATMSEDSVLLFQSIELLADAIIVRELMKHMNDVTLVSGLAIDSCHRFEPGRQPLGGLTAPWNTFAIWNVKLLGRTGFLPISDGVPPLGENDAGVEEVAAIALLQTLFPGKSEAKLIRLNEAFYSWDIDFKCPKRQQQHHAKMHSKMMRPTLQLQALGDIQKGSVIHIDARIASTTVYNCGDTVAIEPRGRNASSDSVMHSVEPIVPDQLILNNYVPHFLEI